MALFIIGLVLGLGCLGYLIFVVAKFIKQHDLGDKEVTLDRDFLFRLLSSYLLQGVTTIMSSIGLVMMNKWSLQAYEYVLLISGSYILGGSFNVLLSSFLLRYYKIGLQEKLRQKAKLAIICSSFGLILGAYLLTTGIAGVIPTPFVNGISFTRGFKYIEPGSEGAILWYGILIVIGAVIAYFTADHIDYKNSKQHGRFEPILIIAFIFGIIGARLWSCLILDFNYYKDHVGEIFQIWNGGLAIQGGILLGTIAIFVYLKISKKMTMRYAIDVGLPCVLIAQALGRFGNFFNREVYGFAVSGDVMKIFPRIFVVNMYIDGNYHLPLFFIECITNIAGFFIIRYLIGRKLKDKLVPGDLGACYFMWYGLTRIVLEPLREGFTLKIGQSEAFGYMQSWITAFVMFGAGLLLMVGLHLYNYFKNKKGNTKLEAKQ